jgi:hypothetical protein
MDEANRGRPAGRSGRRAVVVTNACRQGLATRTLLAVKQTTNGLQAEKLEGMHEIIQILACIQADAGSQEGSRLRLSCRNEGLPFCQVSRALLVRSCRHESRQRQEGGRSSKVGRKRLADMQAWSDC